MAAQIAEKLHFKVLRFQIVRDSFDIVENSNCSQCAHSLKIIDSDANQIASILVWEIDGNLAMSDYDFQQFL